MCLDGVKTKTGDFGVCDKVRFPSGTLKKKDEPQNTFLKSPDARMHLPGRPLGRVKEPLDVRD